MFVYLLIEGCPVGVPISIGMSPTSIKSAIDTRRTLQGGRELLACLSNVVLVQFVSFGIMLLWILECATMEGMRQVSLL